MTEQQIRSIPKELQNFPQWHVYKLIDRGNGKKGKPPVSPVTGNPIFWNNPKTFLTFDQALSALKENKPRNLAGLGFVFTGEEPFSGIDIDSCLTGSGVVPGVLPILERFKTTYTEVSPSGKGLRIIGRGKLPEGDAGGKRGNFEAYSAKRFLTITGNTFEGRSSIGDFTENLAWFRREYTTIPKIAPGASPCVSHSEKTREKPNFPDSGDGYPRSPEDVIRLVEHSKNADKFRNLMAGDDCGDHSRADLALCSILAFYCGKDPALIEATFNLSKLAEREKWKRADYRARTIQTAIEKTGDTFRPSPKPENKKRYAEPEKAGLPKINANVETGHLERCANAGLDALSAGGAGVYKRAGDLVEIRRDDNIDLPEIVWPTGEPYISVLSMPVLREMLDKMAVWSRWNSKTNEDQVIPPPKSILETILARGRWPNVPTLTMVTENPMFCRDGSIIENPGWDNKTGVFFAPVKGENWTIPKNPTACEIREAKNALSEVFCDFPFRRDCHLSAAISAILTLLSGLAYLNRPLFMFDANIRGSGKTLAADTCSLIANGRPLPKMAQSKDVDEDRKRIFSLALCGARAILVDNVDQRFGNSAIDAAITCEGRITDRLLGFSEMKVLPFMATWFVTGNNIQCSGDVSRRIIPIKMISEEERPEGRTDFKHPDLRAWVVSNRVRLATAGLSILRGFAVAGSPDQGLKPYGSFENWSKIVRNAVVWCGFADPLEGNEEVQQDADSDIQAIRAVLRSWYDTFGEIPMTLSAVSRTIQGDPDFAEDPEGTRRRNEALSNLFDALAVISPCENTGKWDVKGAGYVLKKYKERVIGGLRFERVADRNSVGAWKVRQVRKSEARRPEQPQATPIYREVI
ncbi:MAG: hypothetical protein WA705_12410 [Candidatus Ozemobacteraceae bacterium]